ncbi:murein biosynthesis integral membrane protein MurJ, partial [Candidatus Shapirobacteria bacterium]|nr:murein biosynthesis integral membrane protein MurJ [Candidatus Shapirobacteria bacterium]
MVKRLLHQGSQIFTQRQKTILAAAVIIMLTIAASRVLGLVRNRVLAQFFAVESLSVYFAAFRIPETIFEILVFGTFSSAFIPTFTSFISQRKKDEAWYVASVSLNFAFLIFLFLAFLIFLFANPLYHLVAPGFSDQQTLQIANLSRVLLLAQAFFVLSYFLTSVLESLQRFLVPALAPILYNLGIILGTIFLSARFGLYGPVLGAVIGAFFHFLIQLPLSLFLGFRPKLVLNFRHPGVKEVGRLALPRIVELSSLQVGKMAELFLASLVSVAAYTYYTFANSLALLPIGLFGTSIAKASLPTLSYQVASQKMKDFSQTLTSLFNQVVFLILPSSVFLAVLRIPVVRLVFGAERFTWQSTVQTGWTLSAFCLGIFTQALIYPLTRAFWAMHDTKTPVKIS